MLSVVFLWIALNGDARAQDGWGGDQPAEEPAQDPVHERDEDPSDEPGDLEFLPPSLLEVPALAWPEGVPPRSVPVVLGLLIDESGAVEDAYLIDGPEPFATLALEAAPGLEFSPATDGGEPIVVELPFTWTFDPPPVNVTGHLRVAGSRAPAQRVTVHLDGKDTETDADGHFEYRGIAPGPHVIEIVDAGLRVKPVEVVVVADEILELEILAKPESGSDEAIGVYYRSRTEVVSRALTADELRTTPGTMGDPVRAVQNLPGVVRTPFDSGWLLVRGGDPEDTGVFIDGVRVPLIYHLGGFTSVMHPAMVEGIRFMPGGTSARYGRATAGAVELDTAVVEGQRRVELGADLIHAGVYLQTPITDNHNVALALRRSYLDKALQVALSEEQARIAPRFFDWQVRWDSDHFGLFFLGYKDSIDAPTGNDDEVVEVDILTNRLHGRAEFDTALGHFHLTPVVGLDERVFDYSTEYQELTRNTGALRAELSAPDDHRLDYVVGVDGLGGTYRIAVDQTERESSFVTVDPYAAIRVGDDRRVTLGGRADTLYLPGHLLRTGLSPRLQAAWQVNRRLQLVADASIVHQPPPFDILVGLPDGKYLDLEKARGTGAGARLRGQNIGFDIDGYWRHLDRVTLFEDDGTITQGRGMAYGIETLTRWSWRSLGGWIAYTYSRSLRQEELGDLYRPHIYDQPHYLVAVMSWDLPRQLTLAGRWRYGAGYPRLADEAYDLLQTDSLEVPLDTRLDRLPPYHALDLKISKRATFRAWQLEGYLDIQNVYNRRIPEPLITGIDDTETVYGFGLPVLPIFGLKGVFWPGAG